MEEKLANGYNHITDNTVKTDKPLAIFDVNALTKVEPSTPFITALRFSLIKSQYVKNCIADITSILRRLESAAKVLDLINTPICEIQMKHIKLCLDECMKSRVETIDGVDTPIKGYTAKRFNKAKAYISGLFHYLVEVGASYGNAAMGIRILHPKLDEVTEPLDIKQTDIDSIKKYLWTNNRPE